MRTCSEDHDQLLILKKHRCSLWHEFGFQPTPGENTSNSILTQCNIKGLKAFENHAGRNGNIKFTQPRRAQACTMTSEWRNLRWSARSEVDQREELCSDGTAHAAACFGHFRDTTFSFKTLLSALIICFVHSTSRSQRLWYTVHPPILSPAVNIHSQGQHGSGLRACFREAHSDEDPCTLTTKYTVH